MLVGLLAQRVYGVWFESHGIVSWLLLGLIAGWLAGKIARGRGFGCIADIVLGLVGSFIGGWVFTKLEILFPRCGHTWRRDSRLHRPSVHWRFPPLTQKSLFLLHTSKRFRHASPACDRMLV